MCVNMDLQYTCVLMCLTVCTYVYAYPLCGLVCVHTCVYARMYVLMYVCTMYVCMCGIYACLSPPLLPGLTSKRMIAIYDYNPEEDSPNDPEDRKVN